MHILKQILYIIHGLQKLAVEAENWYIYITFGVDLLVLVPIIYITEYFI